MSDNTYQHLSKRQTKTLINQIVHRHSVILDKSQVATIRERKREAWEQITSFFNSMYPDTPKSTVQLKSAWVYLKKKLDIKPTKNKKKRKLIRRRPAHNTPQIEEAMSKVASVKVRKLKLGNNLNSKVVLQGIANDKECQAVETRSRRRVVQACSYCEQGHAVLNTRSPTRLSVPRRLADSGVLKRQPVKASSSSSSFHHPPASAPAPAPEPVPCHSQVCSTLPSTAAPPLTSSSQSISSNPRLSFPSSTSAPPVSSPTPPSNPQGTTSYRHPLWSVRVQRMEFALARELHETKLRMLHEKHKKEMELIEIAKENIKTAGDSFVKLMNTASLFLKNASGTVTATAEKVARAAESHSSCMDELKGVCDDM